MQFIIILKYKGQYSFYIMASGDEDIGMREYLFISKAM